MSRSFARLQFLGDRLSGVDEAKIEEAAEYLFRDRLGPGAAARLRQLYSINSLLERYVLGPPHIAAELIKATLHAWARREAPKVRPAWAHAEIIDAIKPVPLPAFEPEELASIIQRQGLAWADGAPTSTRRGGVAGVDATLVDLSRDPGGEEAASPSKERRLGCEEAALMSKGSSLGCEDAALFKKGRSLDSEASSNFAEPVKPHMLDNSMGWLLTFGSWDMESRFQHWLLFSWRSKMAHRDGIAVIVFMALLLSSWPSGAFTRFGLLFNLVSTWFLRGGLSISQRACGQVLMGVIRAMVVVSGSFSQVQDASSAKLGLGVLSLQATALHVVLVSMGQGALLSLQLPATAIVLGASLVMIPALCNEAFLTNCPALAGWHTSLAVQLVTVMGLPVLWQYFQERATRRLFLRHHAGKQA